MLFQGRRVGSVVLGFSRKVGVVCHGRFRSNSLKSDREGCVISMLRTWINKYNNLITKLSQQTQQIGLLREKSTIFGNKCPATFRSDVQVLPPLCSLISANKPFRLLSMFPFFARVTQCVRSLSCSSLPRQSMLLFSGRTLLFSG